MFSHFCTVTQIIDSHSGYSIYSSSKVFILAQQRATWYHSCQFIWVTITQFNIWMDTHYCLHDITSITRRLDEFTWIWPRGRRAASRGGGGCSVPELLPNLTTRSRWSLRLLTLQRSVYYVTWNTKSDWWTVVLVSKSRTHLIYFPLCNVEDGYYWAENKTF